jgi:hypothetical protein
LFNIRFRQLAVAVPVMDGLKFTTSSRHSYIMWTFFIYDVEERDVLHLTILSLAKIT